MVDILAEMDEQRESRTGPLALLEADAAALKRALTPLFDSDLEQFGVPELRELVASVGFIVSSLESQSRKFQGTTIHDPMVRRSVAAVQAASIDLQQHIASLVLKYPAIG